MNILIRNKANIPNKYIRFIKWKLYQMYKKFNFIEYVEVYFKKEGVTKENFIVNMKIGVSGPDIIIKKNHKNPNLLFSEISEVLKIKLSEYKEKTKIKTKTFSY